jgi:hypothetical protein
MTILKLKNALVKSVYYITCYAICNLVTTFGLFTISEAKGKALYFYAGDFSGQTSGLTATST